MCCVCRRRRRLGFRRTCGVWRAVSELLTSVSRANRSAAVPLVVRCALPRNPQIRADGLFFFDFCACVSQRVVSLIFSAEPYTHTRLDYSVLCVSARKILRILPEPHHNHRSIDGDLNPGSIIDDRNNCVAKRVSIFWSRASRG